MLAGGLVAGIVINKSADDREKAKRADGKPTTVTCVQTNAVITTVQAAVAGSTATNRPTTTNTVTSARGRLDATAGTAYDRRATADVSRALGLVQEQLRAGRTGDKLDPSALSATAVGISLACQG